MMMMTTMMMQFINYKIIMLIFLDNFYILQEEKGEPEGDDKETKTQDEEISQDQQREKVRQNHWRNQSFSENFINSILQRVSIC